MRTHAFRSVAARAACISRVQAERYARWVTFLERLNNLGLGGRHRVGDGEDREGQDGNGGEDG